VAGQHAAVSSSAESVCRVLSALCANGVQCDLFGGWAEELLGLRGPGPHRDIDLVYRAANFRAADVAMDHLGARVEEVSAKRFAHKRAFIFEGILCELLLVQDWNTRPVTLFWGEIEFVWDVPLLHHLPCLLGGSHVSVVAGHNLAKYREQRRSTQPQRWSDPAALIPKRPLSQGH
jgi:hypothetical protein